MAGELISEQDVLKRWGISRLALEKLIARGLLSVTEEEGVLKFPEEEVQALEKSEGGDDFISLDDAMLELHVGKDDVETMVSSGQLPQYNFGGDPKFHTEDLTAVSQMAGISGDETAEIVTPETIPMTDSAKLDIGAAAGGQEEGEEGDLFDFSEDLGDLTGEPAGEEGGADEFPETDMITEIVDVSGAESGEEDILGDIIEDVSAEADLTAALDDELTAAAGGDDTLDADTSQEGTGEITELEEEALGELEPSEEVTAEITQLEEETFEGEELENILAGEEEIPGGEAEGEEEEFDVPYGAPIAAPAEEIPMAGWLVIIMVVILIVQILGGLYVVETAISPKHHTGITEMLNVFKEE